MIYKWETPVFPEFQTTLREGEHALKYDYRYINKRFISSSIEYVTHINRIRTNFNHSDYKQFGFWIKHLVFYNEVSK